ncbi:hypothetical protein LJR225_001882 [Phenylobacterium sp. LjRoot225]|uniref:hypothetical protein n=1 Tax=Phenylobacterium sp. LjRoot225 TaxID=3342285 RepID=UPI003ED0887B
MLVAVGIALWMLIAPGERFLGEFAHLLSEARVRRGPFSLLSGRSYASGLFRGREVAVRLQLKRSRYSPGYLVLAVRTSAQGGLGAAAFLAQTWQGAAGQARSWLDDRNLELSVEGEWLKVLWQPQGFVIFPGRFSAETWTQVLEAMATIASSLGSDTGVSRHDADGG